MCDRASRRKPQTYCIAATRQWLVSVGLCYHVATQSTHLSTCSVPSSLSFHGKHLHEQTVFESEHIGEPTTLPAAIHRDSRTVPFTQPCAYVNIYDHLSHDRVAAASQTSLTAETQPSRRDHQHKTHALPIQQHPLSNRYCKVQYASPPSGYATGPEPPSAIGRLFLRSTGRAHLKIAIFRKGMPPRHCHAKRSRCSPPREAGDEEENMLPAGDLCGTGLEDKMRPEGGTGRKPRHGEAV